MIIYQCPKCNRLRETLEVGPKEEEVCECGEPLKNYEKIDTKEKQPKDETEA